MLNSASGLVLASIFNFTGTRPTNLGKSSLGDAKSSLRARWVIAESSLGDA
jgi:hypothetical protein